MRPLNPAYVAAILYDTEIHKAVRLDAHTSDWSNPRVHKVIGHKLALDRLERRQILPAQRLALT